MNPIESFIGSYFYTLPELMLGFAVVYFTYVRPAKLKQKHVLIGLLIIWAIFAFLVFLLGEGFLGVEELLAPIVIGYIVFFVLRNKVNKQNLSESQQA